MSDTRIDFLYLNEKDMIDAGVLDAGHCVETMEEVLCLLAKGDVLMGGKNRREHGIQLIFPKESEIPGFPLEDSRDRRFMSMPAYLGGRFHLALAYMSANLLSAMRTGAVPGVVAKRLSVKNPKVLTLLGPGVVNKTCLMAYMSQFDSIDTIKIKGSSAASATAKEMERFIKEKYPQISHIVLCGTDEEAVKDADIISEATSVEKRRWPVLKPEWIKPGCLIISSGTMDFSDYDFMVKDIRKIVDNYPMYEEYIEIYEEWDENGKRLSSGIPGMYYVNMVDDGKIERSEVTELGEILLGEKKGRKSDDEIIMVSVGGMPILDVGWGYECYCKAKEKGIGTTLNLWEKPYLY